MSTVSAPPVLVPLPLCSTASWQYALPRGNAGRGAGDRAAELCRVVDAFTTEYQRSMASQGLNLTGKAQRIASAANALLAEVQPGGSIGRAVLATVDELEGVRKAHDEKADAALDSLPAVRVQRAAQVAGDLAAHVLAPADVERFAAALRAGDRDAVEGALLLPRFGPLSAFREQAEAAFRAKFVAGGEVLSADVAKAELMGVLLRLLLVSVRAGLTSHLAAANRGEPQTFQPDAKTLLALADDMGPIEAAAREHGLLRAGTAANSGTFDRSFGGPAPRA